MLAAALGVTPNTVARWERGEVPIPPWVSLVIDAGAQAPARTQAARDRARELEAQLAALKARTDARVQALKATITRLELRNLTLEVELRERRRRSPHPPASPLKAEQIFKRLARRYHPDRHPEFAEVMADLNELYQAMRR